ncbi:hypothetical protein [Mesorhizobium sp. ANAO-SY3R2]|uniref:hypothetical protein n=1 Tax=Mesorhizobium sp. ANAO-SY3R2 TaxID=3166644 RepID=UPI00367158BD
MMHIGSLASGTGQTVRAVEAVVSPAASQVGSNVGPQGPSQRPSHIHVPSKESAFAARGASGATLGFANSSRTVDKDVENAHQTAWSALKNERFRHVLEQLSDVGTSDAMMLMRRVDGGGTDFQSARAIYAENSE